MNEDDFLVPTPSNSRYTPTYHVEIDKISIDKIRVVGDFNPVYLDDLMAFKSQNLHLDVREDKQQFRGFYESVDGERINFEFNQSRAYAMKSSNIWIEWNPNKFKDEYLIEIIDALFQFTNNAHLTRADLAFDIQEDLSSYQIYNNTAIAERIYFGRTGAIETRYIGSPNSDRQIRIYNKKLQLLTKEKIKIPQDVLWRLEVVLKSDKIYDIENALENINLYRPDYSMFDDIKTRAMFYFLDNHKHEWDNIDSRTKTKYRKLIRDTQEFNLTEVLKKNLTEEKEGLISNMNGYLQLFNTSKKIQS